MVTVEPCVNGPDTISTDKTVVIVDALKCMAHNYPFSKEEPPVETSN